MDFQLGRFNAKGIKQLNKIVWFLTYQRYYFVYQYGLSLLGRLITLLFRYKGLHFILFFGFEIK